MRSTRSTELLVTGGKSCVVVVPQDCGRIEWSKQYALSNFHRSDGFGSNMIGDPNAFHFASAKDEEMEDDSLGRSIVDRQRGKLSKWSTGCAQPEYYFDEPSPSNARARGSKISFFQTPQHEEEDHQMSRRRRRKREQTSGRNLESVNLLSGTGVGSSPSPNAITNRDERWGNQGEVKTSHRARIWANTKEPGAKQTAHLDSMFSGLRPYSNVKGVAAPKQLFNKDTQSTTTIKIHM